MAKTIDITDEATPLLKEMAGKLKPGEAENVIGRAATNFVSAHFARLDVERPNALGGKRTHFYAQASRSTNYQARPGEVVISVNQVGIRQRLEGGWIMPTGSRKYLTIPADAAAHGRRASEFSNLRFGFAQNKYGNLQPALIETNASTFKFKKRKVFSEVAGKKVGEGTTISRSVQTGSKGGKVLYFLSRRVFQRADPTVLPPTPEIVGVALQAVRKWIATRGQKGAS